MRHWMIFGLAMVMSLSGTQAFAQSASSGVFANLAAEADPHSGSLNFGIPIEVQTGRAGIQPNLQLQYNSGRGNGLLGVGWGFEIGSIQISSQAGAPKYDGTDQYVLLQNGSAQELLDVGGGLYQPRVEGAFMRIEKIAGSYFEVTDKSGTIYTFGQNSNAREYDSANSTHVYKWCLERVEDVHGNYMTFRYVRHLDKLYPEQILYTANDNANLAAHARVDFILEARPDDAVIRYRSGFAMGSNKRLAEIRVYAMNELQRAYQMNYAQSQDTDRSLLQSVTQVGADGTSTLPAAQFTYQTKTIAGETPYVVANIDPAQTTGDNRWNYRWDDGYDREYENYGAVAPTSGGSAGFGGLRWGAIRRASGSQGGRNWTMSGNGNLEFKAPKDSANWLWTHVYIAGTQDRIITIAEQNDGFTNPNGAPIGFWINGRYQQNQTSQWRLKPGWNLIEITAYHQHQDVEFKLNEALAAQVDIMNSVPLVQNEFFADMNADGRADIVAVESATGKVDVRLANGAGFFPAETWLSSFRANAQVLAFDGIVDGRTDLFYFEKNTGNWYIAQSDGTQLFASNNPRLSGFGVDKDPVTGDFNGDGMTDVGYLFNSGAHKRVKIALNNGTTFDIVANSFKVANVSSHQVSMADFNGDGLTDACSFDQASGQWLIRINLGRSTLGFIDGATVTNWGTGKPAVLADFNGDGMTDIGYYDSSQDTLHYRTSKGGYGFSANSYSEPVNLGLGAGAVSVQLVDVNGDSLADIVARQAGVAKLALSAGQAFDVLQNMDNGLGSQTDVAYISALQQCRTTHLPFPLQVVKSITQSGAGESYSTTYHYSRGIWDDDERQFRGFGRVTSFSPQGSKSVSYFHQDSILQGRLSKRYNYDREGVLLNSVTMDWQIEDLGGGVSFPYLRRQDNFVHDQTVIAYDYSQNAATSGQASADSMRSEIYNPNKAFDGNERSYFSAGGNVKDFTLQYDFGEDVTHVINRYRITHYGLIETTPRDWFFEGSDDPQNGWVILDQQVAQKNAIANTSHTYDFNNSTPYRYYRLHVTNGGPAMFLTLAELEMFVQDVPVYGGRRTAEEFEYNEPVQRGHLTLARQLGEVDIATGDDIGTDQRLVETGYVHNTQAWILGLPEFTIIYDEQMNPVRQTWFRYDNQAQGGSPILGLLTEKEDDAGVGQTNPVTQYTYDMVGNLLTTTDPRQHTTTITYDIDTNIFPVLTTNALNHSVTNTYYGVDGQTTSGSGYYGLWGQLKSTTDPNNETGERVYDSFGRLVKAIGPLDSLSLPSVSYEYFLSDQYSTLTTRRRLSHGDPEEIVSTQYVDPLGRTMFTRSPAADPTKDLVSGEQVYNEFGQLVRQHTSRFIPTGTMPDTQLSAVYSELNYDDAGRVIQECQQPAGFCTSQSYDLWRQETINANGHKQRQEFDAYGRLIRVTDFSGADGRAAAFGYGQQDFQDYTVTEYEYDSEGSLLKTIQDVGADNIVTLISYDKLGRKVSMNDPGMGSWGYEYDVNGNLIRQTDAKSQIIAFEYDELNRLTRKFFPADQSQLGVDYTYDVPYLTAESKGRLSEARYSPQDSTQFGYDELGREIESVKAINGTDFRVTRDYDALNRLLKVDYPDGQPVHYGYDAAGQINAIVTAPGLLP